ncbi:MAG: NB-ARC domain-containing protein [Cyanobacteria bacterium P01_A01_bin.114]
MVTFKASAEGLVKIRQARKSQGLPIYDFYWLQTASEIMGVDWSVTGKLARGISEGTWKRFLAGRQAINASAFKAYCQMLGLDWQKVREAVPALPGVMKAKVAWGDAPDCPVFWGREQTLQQLTHWITQEGCRLVSISGAGGVGKTTLTVQLAQSLIDDFEQIIWRSLRYAPAAEKVIRDCLQVLSTRPSGVQSQSLDHLQHRVLEAFTQHRCLLILDDGETLLDEGKTGRYRPGYEAYEQVLQTLAYSHHNSCVIFTSRETPSELAPAPHLPARSLQLKGLSMESAIALLEAKGIIGSPQEIQTLVQQYDGNPLALKIAAALIQDLCSGQLSSFLRQRELFGNVWCLLEQQFERLSAPEQQIIHGLICDRTLVTLQTLQQDLFPPIPPAQLLESLESLAWRGLIEKIRQRETRFVPAVNTPAVATPAMAISDPTEIRFCLPPVVMNYGTSRLIAALTEDLLAQDTLPLQQGLLHHYALFKPHSPANIREAQIQCILTPLLAHLHQVLGSPQQIYRCLTLKLSQLHQQHPHQVGYAAGNLVNLLGHLQTDLSDLDLSQLPLWHANLRDKILQRANLSEADLYQTAFTPTFSNISTLACRSDGQWLASGDAAGEIRLWDLATDTLQALLKGHQGKVLCVVFSPDGQWLASSSEDQTVKLWSVATGQCCHTWQCPQTWVGSVAFSADSAILASASKEGSIRLWALDTKAAMTVLTGHHAAVCAIAWHPRSGRLVSGSEDGTLRLWNPLNRKCLRIFRGHSAWAWSVSFSKNGEWIVSGSSDGSIKLWSVRDGGSYPFTGHTSSVWSVQFHPTAAELVSGGEDSLIKRWDIKTGRCIQTLSGHAMGVTALAFTPDGQTLISGGVDRRIKLWDAQTGQCDRTWQGYSRQVHAAAFNPNGQQVASGGSTPGVTLWDIAADQTPAPARSCRLPAGRVWRLAYNSTGSQLITGELDGILSLWDTQTGQLIKTLQGHPDQLWTLALHPQGTLVASAGVKPEICLWQVATGRCQQLLSGHTSGIWAVAFHPNGQWLASGGVDATIRYWAVSTGACLLRWESRHRWVLALAFSPDGRCLASGHADGAVQVRDLRTGETRTFLGHTKQVRAVVFSPDGQWLASSGADCCIKLWHLNLLEHDLKEAGSRDVESTPETLPACWKTLQGHHGVVRAVDVSPDGQTLISASDDGSLKRWDIQSGQLLQTLMIDRPYEKMQSSGMTGITPAQKLTLIDLGAVDAEQSLSPGVRRETLGSANSPLVKKGSGEVEA